MKKRLRKSMVLPGLLAAQCAVCLALTQAGNKGRDTKAEANTYIARYYVGGATPGSTYETGPLRIIFSDGRDVIQDLPPKEKSTEDHIVSNQEGFSDVQLAEDRQTLGWTETYDNCGTSYAIPLVVVLFRSGKVLQRIQTGQMVWSWMFFDRGNKAAVVWGPTHGPEVGDFKLYDIRTGKVLAEVYGDAETQALKADAPSWARKLEARLNGNEPGN